jgi:23S rRNA (uracil1939-C5)-methyltransferase
MARKRRRNILPTETYTAEITGLSHDGRGIAHIDGKVAFIHGALPGELVKFQYTKQQRSKDEGIVCEVITASADRIDPGCAHYATCGGCSLQHLTPEAQILAKQQQLLDNLTRIGKVEPAEILTPMVNENPWGYRRKARLGVKHVFKKGRVLVGFRERGKGFIADIQQCPVLHPQVGEKLPELARLIEKLSIYDQIPQIEVVMDDTQCVLIFRVLSPPSLEDLQKLSTFGKQHGYAMYLQPGGPDSIVPLEGFAVDLSYALPDHGIRLSFLPGDFTQVNTLMNRQMVNQALALLAPNKDEKVLDLFCGVGNFTLPLALLAGAVVGVEGDAGLVQGARDNAVRNALTNVDFYTANLYEPLQPAHWLNQTYQKALLDPPRSGAQQILARLPTLGIQQIVYISCYPSTLARDASELVHEHGYHLQCAGVMDMFPQTAHVESIALFTRDAL